MGWLNTFQGMAAPYALMTPFAVFFLRQMFLGTPADVEEAARIDGASYFAIFFRRGDRLLPSLSFEHTTHE